MTNQLEPFSAALVQAMLPLFDAHFKEVGHYQDIKLDPDWAAYEAADRAKGLRVYTVRDRSELVGYAVFFVRANPHYRGSIQAVQDILYLSPKTRKGLSGYKFICWCDQQLAEEGVQAVYHHVKNAHNFGVMLERMGYELVDLIYARRLS